MAMATGLECGDQSRAEWGEAEVEGEVRGGGGNALARAGGAAEAEEAVEEGREDGPRVARSGTELRPSELESEEGRGRGRGRREEIGTRNALQCSATWGHAIWVDIVPCSSQGKTLPRLGPAAHAPFPPPGPDRRTSAGFPPSSPARSLPASPEGGGPSSCARRRCWDAWPAAHSCAWCSCALVTANVAAEAAAAVAAVTAGASAGVAVEKGYAGDGGDSGESGNI